MTEEELPEGWAEARLGDIADVTLGKMLDKAKRTAGRHLPYLRNINVRWGEFDLSDIFTMPFLDEELERFAVEPDDLLICEGGEPGRSAVWKPTKQEIKFQKAILRARMSGEVDPRWCMFSLRREAATGELEQYLTGSTIKHFPLVSAKDYLLPLPPLAEQRRIVEKVEALLAQVNRARARLAKVPAILKRFRQSILSAACSGRLTEDWRASIDTTSQVADLLAKVRCRRAASDDSESPSEMTVPEEWAIIHLGEIAERITSGSRAWSKYYSEAGASTFVMAQNVRPLLFDQSTRQGVSPPKQDAERERTRVQRDDILVTIVGVNTGDVCRVPIDIDEHYVCQSVALVRPSLPAIAPFLELFLNSVGHGRGQFLGWMYGEGRPHLGLDHLRRTAVAVPSLPEQHEIVRRVDALFKLADAIEAHVAAATARADKMTQAILAKAFRGELVPTEAELARQEGRDYEPASALLARIRAARELAATPARAKRATPAAAQPAAKAAARKPKG